MEEFEIQKMTHKNLDNILEIEELCYGPHHWSRESFLTELNNKISSYYVVVNNENRCIGYSGLWKIVDEAHITNLCVHPKYQNKKIAHKLLLNIIEECYREKIKFITLEVRISNKRAIHLYKKFGFKSLGVRKKYYQDNNEDALIMWSENIFDEKYKQLYDKIKKDLIGINNVDK